MTHIANCLRSATDKRFDMDYNSSNPDHGTRLYDSVYSPAEADRLPLARPLNTSRYQLWPSPSKNDTPRAASPTSDRPRASTVANSSCDLKELANQKENESMFTKNISFTGRRKPGLPDIQSTMTTVQELPADSPTIPGRPPMTRTWTDPARQQPCHERSQSAPGASWAACSFGDAMLSQVTGPAPTARQMFSNSSIKNLKKLARPLSPILSPGNSKPSLKVQTNTPSLLSPQLTPPAVPPKSPLVLRNSPADSQFSASAPSSAVPISACPSTSAAATSVSPMVSSPARAVLCGRGSPVLVSTAYRKGSAPDVMCVSERGRLVNTPVNTPTEKPSQESLTTRPRGRSESRSKATPRVDNWKLPTGLRRAEALEKIPEAEQENIRNHARHQVEKFEILDLKKVSDLSKELRALDERCDYLRNTWKSLRNDRHKLHDRLISYLRNDSFNFPREKILQQEETLLELDKSADDWILKLEVAENRRLRLRQKLLEHLAASMGLQASPTIQHHVAATPPGSPIRGLTPVQERKDVQSIKIYADEQVLDLFGDIERAIGKMCESC